MSGSNAQATNTLRPRTKRLISGLSDVGGEDSNSPAVTPDRRPSPAPSPFDSRSASPIPAAHPQRASPRNGANRYAGNSSWGRRAQVGQQRTASAQSASPIAGLWGSSWTTLQGIASDFLGNDPAGPPLKDKQRQRRQLNKLSISRAVSGSAGPTQWGPTPTSNPASVIGSGTREEREAAVRAQKRKQMLTGQDSSYADALGKFKRRLSDDHESMSAPPGENDNRDALVYLHHVKKDDTFAGITIRYNCSANTIRKANRMWPNDTVQSRQTLVLPVDACGVKGKPLSDAQALDLLSSEDEDLSAGQAEEVLTPKAPLPNGTGAAHNRTTSTSTSTSTSRRASSSVAASSIETAPQWHHDSWTLLSNNTTPTEIARLSRRALGYFPPARRKSNSYSDLDTPSTSLDLRRASTQDPPVQPSQRDSSQRPRRPRRLSNATTGYYPSYLSGPGGVGTMSRSVHTPGPAQDGLNKRFAKLLPDVGPPKNQVDLYQPEIPLYHDEPTPLGSGVQTPSYPHGTANLNINLENVGGAIEGWMRRMATKALTPTERPAVRGPRASVGTPGRGLGGIGDLIEMTDEFEIGGDEDEESDGDRGRPGSTVYLGSGGGGGGSSGTGADYFGGASTTTAKGRSVSGKGAKDD